MILYFATCDTGAAVRYLKTGYPNRDISEATCPKLFDALRRDILRITDPAYHPLAIIGGDNYSNNVALAHECSAELDNSPTIDKTEEQ